MLDAHQAVPTKALRPAERGAFPQGTNGKNEAIQALLFEFISSTVYQDNYSELSTVNHRVFLRIVGVQHKRPDHHRMTSYNCALEITQCESIEATVCTGRRLWAETLIQMSGCLSKRKVFINLEGAVRRGRVGNEKEWMIA